MKRNSWLLPLIALVLLSLYLRLFHLQELFYFTHDEETVVWRVMPLLRDNNMFLLGGVTPLHVHLGPWFYYLSAAILSLSQLNPLGLGVAGAIVGAITTGLLFFLGKRFFNQRVGFLAALFYSVSFLQVAFDRHWWPLVLDPIIGLASILLLAGIIRKKLYLTPWLAAILALGFHADLSTAGLLLLVSAVWLKYKLPLKHKSVLLGVAIFAASFLPLAAFDLKNQGVNLEGINQYLTETKPEQGLSLNRFIWTLLYIPRGLSRLVAVNSPELTQSYSYCRQYSQGRLEQVPPLLVAATSGAVLYFLLQRKRQPLAWIISSYFVLTIVGLNLYGNFFSSDLFDHYLATLFPLFFLILAIGADRLMKGSLKTVAVLAIVGAVFLNLNSLSKMSNSQGFTAKQQAVAWVVSELKGQPFALDSVDSCFRYNGTRYLFTLLGHEPDLSFVDPNFFWLYAQPPKTDYPDNLVIFIDSQDSSWRQRNPEYLNHLKAQNQFNGLEVLIVDNADKNFSIKF